MSESSRGSESVVDGLTQRDDMETPSMLDETTNTAGFHSFLNKDRSIGPSGGPQQTGFVNSFQQGLNPSFNQDSFDPRRSHGQ